LHGTCSVIINRLSGTFSQRKADQVQSFLDSTGMEPRLFFIDNLEDATIISRRICAENENPLIIAGGGDGTVNGVLNGLTPGTATIAVLPLGTSNVLTKELSILSLEDALQRIARGRTKSISAGLIEKDTSRRYFLLMAGVGFDASVVQGVQIREKRLLGKGAYMLSAVRGMIRWETDLMEVVSDGSTRYCHSLIVCNSSKYAGTCMIAPEASIFEPVFEVVCIHGMKRACYLRAAAMLLTGKGLRGAGMSTFRAGTLTVSGSKPVQIDGDYICRAPVKITVVPDFVRLTV